MKTVLKIFSGNKEISIETLKNRGIYEEVISEIKEKLRSGRTWGEYDNEINWGLYVSE